MAETRPARDGGQQGKDDAPLHGVATAGVAQAGGESAHAQNVKSDPHVHEAVPGALKGPEAVGSGQPLPDKALDGMQARLDAGIPEPPKVGPVGNVDLYDTPGGYVAVPAGLKPEDVTYGVTVRPVAREASVDTSGAEVKHVAGPGTRPVKG